MYHALFREEMPSGQDPHYTLHADDFDRHLQQLAATQGGTSTAAVLNGFPQAQAILTFDDGHMSNFTLAFPMLLKHGMRADFFINPATVGTPGFARWSELREMAEAGMSIQSHGYDHVYLTHLSARKLRETLSAARHEIEQRIGQPVTLLAPPGGRMPANLTAIARECGYARILSSIPGRLPRVLPGDSSIPRMAVTRAIDETVFARWIEGNRSSILRERLRYQGLSLAKRMLGDAGYERVRARTLAALRGAS
ncbi:polysaccharide deacetylase family protein [Pseudoxanthomonas kalamensis]|uniref:polysaccharide deacetylase family protein n=1 Tax=Pseudoxanthomonas kalamensis TaxID=289483 RepID=UPI001391DC01|nr:polysaccharide deacetylase family protein [Pseudoxanthomonas kalamensis]